MNQRLVPPIDGRLISLGRFNFEKTGQSFVIVSNERTDGHVIADAVQFIPVDAVAEAPAKDATGGTPGNAPANRVREVEADLLYGEGISREGDLLDMGVSNNVIEKTGSWYSFRGERIGQGRDNTRIFLKENKEIAARIEKEVLAKAGIGPKDATASKEAAKEASSSKKRAVA